MCNNILVTLLSNQEPELHNCNAICKNLQISSKTKGGSMSVQQLSSSFFTFTEAQATCFLLLTLMDVNKRPYLRNCRWNDPNYHSSLQFPVFWHRPCFKMTQCLCAQVIKGIPFWVIAIIEAVNTFMVLFVVQGLYNTAHLEDICLLQQHRTNNKKVEFNLRLVLKLKLKPNWWNWWNKVYCFISDKTPAVLPGGSAPANCK